MPSLTLTSSDFFDGAPIPRIYTGEGFNRNPLLEWSGAPEGTREFALICEDLDAKTQAPWTHWLLYGISGAITRIPEGLPTEGTIQAPILARQGRNTGGTLGYDGPFPPRHDSWHRYHFRLYALDHEIALPSGANAEELRQAMKGPILAEATLMGRYRRVHRAIA